MLRGAKLLDQVSQFDTDHHQAALYPGTMKRLFWLLHQLDTAALQQSNFRLVQRAGAVQADVKFEDLGVFVPFILAIRRQYMRTAVMCAYDAAVQIVNRH